MQSIILKTFPNKLHQELIGDLICTYQHIGYEIPALHSDPMSSAVCSNSLCAVQVPLALKQPENISSDSCQIRVFMHRHVCDMSDTVTIC